MSDISTWPSVTGTTRKDGILRWAGVYDHYEQHYIAPEVQMMAKVRGSRVDAGTEYMVLGATLPRAHCASHLKERATRRNDETLSPALRTAMKAEADLIAFGKVPDHGWAVGNEDCVCIGYLNAASKFLREHPLTLIEAQFTVVNRKLRYVGHPDHLVQTALFAGDNRPGPRRSGGVSREAREASSSPASKYELLSIKTGELPNFAGIQEALYLLADPEDFPWPIPRFGITRAVVQFRSDGGYTYKALTDHNDFAVAERWAAGFWDARRICGEKE